MTRIKETISQVKTDVSGKWMSIEEVEKLAELIVKECTAHLHRRGVEGFGILEERNLLEHFGVEE